MEKKKQEIRHVGLRVSPEIHHKLHYIAKYKGRSINGQVYYLILNCIRQFENKHGPIPPAEEDAQS